MKRIVSVLLRASLVLVATSPAMAQTTDSSSTTFPPSSSTSITFSTTSITTPSSSTTSSTVPGGFTRTPGFYKNRPDVTFDILSAAGGLEVCGVMIANVTVDSATSALEAMCISVVGNGRLQLARQLMAAALTEAAGGASFGGFALCDVTCQNPSASKEEIDACIKVTGAFNGSGDDLPAPFGGGGANSTPCQMAHDTDCTILDPSSCALP